MLTITRLYVTQIAWQLIMLRILSMYAVLFGLALPPGARGLSNNDCPAHAELDAGATASGAVLNKDFPGINTLVPLGIDAGGQLNLLVDPSQGYPPPNRVGLRAVTPDSGWGIYIN